MDPEDLPILTDVDIKLFLQSAPLYAWREFKKSTAHRTSLRIDEIDSFCEVCNQRRPFHDLQARGGGAGLTTPALGTGTSYFSFTCVSCKKEKRIYLVEQVVEDGTIKLQKYGQLPRGKVLRDKTLQKFLKNDLDNYEKALICLSRDYGIAAFAYFRRVVENNISNLLDLVQEDALASGSPDDTMDAISELRADSPMSNKIRVANLALPIYLRPDGLNPLGRIYQVLSEGIHNSSEEECLAKAKTTSECLAFLVSELATRKEHRVRFKSVVAKL